MGNVVIFDGLKYRRDKNTGYYLCSKRINGVRERLHRAVWKYHNGEIPEGYHVHHIDENKDNNGIENLELLISNKHESLHGSSQKHVDIIKKYLPRAREEAKKWHCSVEGKRWHKELARNVYEDMQMLEKNCEFCGKTYEVKIIKQGESRFCSGVCKSAWRRREGKDNETKQCAYCGTEFSSNKYDKVGTCSKSCAAKLRWAKRKTGKS